MFRTYFTTVSIVLLTRSTEMLGETNRVSDVFAPNLIKAANPVKSTTSSLTAADELYDDPYFDTDVMREFLTLPLRNDTQPNLPAEFDSREQWPYCPTIGQINDQGKCGSCWAISAVDAMSDRICIHSKGKHKYRLSVSNLVSCCRLCGDGCGGGYHKGAWKYWLKNGIVTGGLYGSEEGCQPYEFKPCVHRLFNSTDSCIKVDGSTPPCRRECRPSYGSSYKEDLHFAKQIYEIAANEEAIKTEIYRNGPVQSSIKLYSDIYSYTNQSGVYEHIKGHLVFHHAIRIIGWGVDKTTNVSYWLVPNTFNTDWGDDGFIRIRRGTNECSIETYVFAGIPLFNDREKT